MKKALILLTSLMMFLLAACSGKTNEGNQSSSNEQENNSGSSEELQPEPGAELTLWTVPDEFTTAAIEEFEEEYGIKVKLEDVFYDKTVDRLKTDGPAGMGADVIVFGHDRLGDAVKSGLILPNDYFEEETKNNSIQTAIDATTVDGILYGYPNYMFTYALYVNKDLVKDAKLDTWEDVIAFSKEFNDIPNNKYGFMMEANSPFFTYSFMSGYGGYVFGKNGTDKNDLGFNNEGGIKGMEVFKSLKEILPVNITDLTRDVKTGLFQEGKVAINMDGSFNARAFKNLPFDISVIPLPLMPGDKAPKAFAGISGYFVTTYSKYPNAAKIFSNFMTTKEKQLENYKVTGSIPVAKGIDETNEIFKDDEVMQGFMKQTKNIEHMPNIPEMNYFWGSVTPTLELIWKGEDIKKTLDKAAESMKENIEAGN